MWSHYFLQSCIDHIKKLRQLNFAITISKVCQSHTLESPQITTYELFQAIFINYIKYETEINSIFNPQESQILIDVVKSSVLKTEEEFNYFMAHLPFYWKILLVIDAVGDFTDHNIFLFPSIQTWVDRHCRQQVKVNFEVSSANTVALVNLNLRSINYLSGTEIGEIVDKIGSIVASIATLYDLPKPEKLNLCYLMTPFTKSISDFKPNSKIDQFLIPKLQTIPNLRYNFERFHNPISSLNVNSGVTMNSADGHYIQIWREEEFYKVLIHELIHYNYLERGDEFNPLPLNISNNYPHYSKELFTELQTWLIYQLWCLSQDPKLVTTRDLGAILDQERQYALEVTGRILAHSGINHIDQFLNHTPQYCVNTNASFLYYYIFKSVLLFQTDSWLEAFLSFGSNSSDQIWSKTTPEQIRKIMMSAKFKNEINRILADTHLQSQRSLRMMRPHLEGLR